MDLGSRIEAPFEVVVQVYTPEGETVPVIYSNCDKAILTSVDGDGTLEFAPCKEVEGGSEVHELVFPAVVLETIDVRDKNNKAAFKDFPQGLEVNACTAWKWKGKGIYTARHTFYKSGRGGRHKAWLWQSKEGGGIPITQEMEGSVDIVSEIQEAGADDKMWVDNCTNFTIGGLVAHKDLARVGVAFTYSGDSRRAAGYLKIADGKITQILVLLPKDCDLTEPGSVAVEIKAYQTTVTVKVDKLGLSMEVPYQAASSGKLPVQAVTGDNGGDDEVSKKAGPPGVMLGPLDQDYYEGMNSGDDLLQLVKVQLDHGFEVATASVSEDDVVTLEGACCFHCPQSLKGPISYPKFTPEEMGKVSQVFPFGKLCMSEGKVRVPSRYTGTKMACFHGSTEGGSSGGPVVANLAGGQKVIGVVSSAVAAYNANFIFLIQD